MIILTPNSYLAQKITLEMGSESIKVGQMYLQIEKKIDILVSHLRVY